MEKRDFEVEVKLLNEKVKFEGVSVHNVNRPIQFDYIAPIGDNDGYRGLELLLTAFGGCVSTSIVFLSRKLGKRVISFRMKLIGIKREVPLSISQINFEAEITGDLITPEEQRTILEQVEKISPVWNMIKGNCEVSGKIISESKV